MTFVNNFFLKNSDYQIDIFFKIHLEVIIILYTFASCKEINLVIKLKLTLLKRP